MNKRIIFQVSPIFALTACISLSGTAFADSFISEFSFGSTEIEAGNSNTEDTYSYSATLFFNPVENSEVPYRVSPFLSQQSSITADYSDSDITENDIDSNAEQVGLNARIVTDGGVVFEFGNSKISRTSSRDGRNLANFGAGFYLGEEDNATIVLRYHELSTGEDQYQLELEGYTEYDGNMMSGKLSATRAKTALGNNANTINAEGTYYINKHFGLSAGIGFSNVSDEDSQIPLSVGFDLFANHNIALSGSYKRIVISEDDPDLKADDIETVNFSLTARF